MLSSWQKQIDQNKWSSFFLKQYRMVVSVSLSLCLFYFIFIFCLSLSLSLFVSLIYPEVIQCKKPCSSLLLVIINSILLIFISFNVSISIQIDYYIFCFYFWLQKLSLNFDQISFVVTESREERIECVNSTGLTNAYKVKKMSSAKIWNCV